MTRVQSCFILIILASVTACTPPAFIKKNQAAQDFGLALDQYLTANDRSALESLASSPESEWSQRARQLLSQFDTYQQQQQALTRQLTENEAKCTTRLQLLQQENHDLTETMDQLKQLFIDMEMRE